MVTTPFEPFKNSTITFLVDDALQPDVTDPAGNPRPLKKEVTIEAFLKPASANSFNAKHGGSDQFTGIGVNATPLTGYVTSDGGRTPIGINPKDRSVYARYRDQEGTFIFLLSLQSAVKADLITGDQIAGIFQVLGGQ